MGGLQETAAEITFIGAGDCGPCGPSTPDFPIERYSELVRHTLMAADVTFANCERAYSARKQGEQLTRHGCQAPEMAKIFTDCGFDAVTLASNHMYDNGPQGLLDTRALMLEKGIQVTGAGKDLAEAREPAIVECKGIKVGFLGYCSVMPQGSAAARDKVGIAALRVKAFYEIRDPHESPRVWTEPEERDLNMIVEDIASLRKQVDIVMVAFHWGVAHLPRVISDYQVKAAHACIDAGADLIIGHHPHMPKAIEIYQGKAIFFATGRFCTTLPGGPSMMFTREPPWVHGAVGNHTDLDPDYPLLGLGKDSNRAILVKAILTKQGIKRVSFLPMKIDTQYRPEILLRGDPRFGDMVSYLDWASKGFDHRFTIEGDEVVVTGAAK